MPDSPPVPDRRTELLWLAQELRGAIDTCKPENLAAIAKQYRDTLAELAGLDDTGEVDRLDDILASGTVTPIQKRTKRSR